MSDNPAVERWDCYEATMDGPTAGNPFVDVDVRGYFAFGHRTVAVRGFYDGDGAYRLRFMPDAVGEWSYTTWSNRPELDGHSGTITRTEASGDNHGPVTVRNQHHFVYADGTRYFPFGTTCYAWIHQGRKQEGETLETLEGAPFNKMRMCVFPKHYVFNHNEPELYAFAGSRKDGSDFSRFNPGFFRHLEQRVNVLRRLGIEADIILFHPYDRWSFSTMTAEQDDRYLRYVVTRLAPYRNVWWSMANEFDFMKDKELTDWDRYFRIVQQEDRYQRSYGKPVVVDESAYEGTIDHGWGNITAEELVRRHWAGVCRGGYVSHGETCYNPEENLWWAKGGTLKGESPARIGFLREILDQTPGEGLYKVNMGWDVAAAAFGEEYMLNYFGFNRLSASSEASQEPERRMVTGQTGS